VGADEAAAALSLAAAAAAADGVSPLSEQIRLHLRFGGDPAARNLFLWHGSELAGFAHLDPPGPAGGSSGELVVHPAHRRQGHGRELAGAVVAQAAPLPVRIWAHGDLPAAAGLAGAARFARVRALWQMMRSLPPGTPEMPALPAGVTLRTFVPGRDEDAWLALNHRAFATHPEQGRWTRDDLARRESEPWFDPAGFFLAERDGRPVAFHWTKVHEPGGTREGPDAVGEVYVLGVDPAEQGTGLGRLLTLAGLRHLAARGIKTVLLYVDESNQSAVRLYEKLSFTHTSTDVMYQHTPPGRSGAHASR
jgi:mycothiol synthase